MKTKRIFSLAFAFFLAFAMVLPLFSATVQAQETLGNKDHFEALKNINYLDEVYHSPEEKLATMTKAAENSRYALYIQEYTAEVALVDKITGQYLFTNPYDLADTSASAGVKYQLLSQILLTYISTSGERKELDSYSDGALNEQIVIKRIRGGVRVEYSMGDAAKRIVVPRQIEKSRFEEAIMRPMYEATAKGDLSFDDYLTLKSSGSASDAKIADDAAGFDFKRFFSYFGLLDLSDPTLSAREQSTILTTYPITEKMAIYHVDEDLSQQELSELESYIRKYTQYSLSDMLSDHEMVEFELENASPAIFRLALEYTLEEEGLQVRLPARGISFDSATYTLDTIQVLPYLGAGRSGTGEAVRIDDGYNFIPDGSGAIIGFDHNTRFTQVSGTLYGNDFGFYNSSSAATASYQTWRAPVYGTVMNTKYAIPSTVQNEEGQAETKIEEKTLRQGYVAFITEGESLTRINAIDGGPSHEYHAVSTTFFARQTDSYPLDGITVSGKSAVYTKEIDRRYVGNYTIKYRLLLDDQASYVGMANVYREYLIKEGILTKQESADEDIPLYLDFLGDIDTTKTVLGMPVNTKAELTTFEDAKKILSELKEAGVTDLVGRYLGWANGGLSATAPSKLKVEKALGGEKGLKELIAYAQQEGFQIFMDLDFAYVNRSELFDGFDTDDHAAKTIDGKPAYLQTYNPIVQAYNTQVAYVLSANSIATFYQKIVDKYSSYFGDGEKNISVGSLGTAVNSSQDEKYPLNREDAKDLTVSALEQIHQNYDRVLLENGNYYSWKYADTILNIPLDSSNRNTTSGEVPFLGILFHGYLYYTGEAINLSGDYEYTLLKTIESGANPYFVVAYQNIPELKVNGYTEYYAVEYGVWKESIVEEYHKLNAVLAPLQGHAVVEHEVLDNRVVRVLYDHGTEIYLNYNNFAVTMNGLELDAMGFAVVGA